MLSQLPRPLGCCWFVVCVLSRCLRLAFFAFCCSQPFWVSFANSLAGCVLSPSWGSLLCCSPPRLVCMVGLGGWGVWVCLLVCVVCGGGYGLFVVSAGVFFWWFFFGFFSGRGRGECRGFLLVFLGGCSNRVFDGVLSVAEGACTGGSCGVSWCRE